MSLHCRHMTLTALRRGQLKNRHQDQRHSGTNSLQGPKSLYDKFMVSFNLQISKIDKFIEHFLQHTNKVFEMGTYVLNLNLDNIYY